jgi:hypothetical protein
MNLRKPFPRAFTAMKTPMMKAFVTALVLALAPTLLQAQNTRTWVSGLGADTNNGARTTPCKTLAGAIAKTNVGGEVDVLDAGNFGSASITRAVTINGDGTTGSIVTTGGVNGLTIVTAATDVVVLRNLNIFCSGPSLGIGINVTGAGTVIIDHCQIAGYVTGIGMITGAAGAKLVLKDSTIENCSGNAVNIAPAAAANVTIARCHFSDSGAGVSVAANGTANITDSVSTGNNGDGFVATSAGATLTLTRCTSFDNVTGVESRGVVTINDCAVLNNTGAGLKFSAGAALATYGNNEVLGNNPDGAPSAAPIAKK